MRYPKVNYIGNKEKLVDWIGGLIPRDARSFFDLFCGGCSVSYYAKMLGLKVIANDILTINYHIAKALIENDRHWLLPQDLSVIFSGNPTEGFMYNHYTNRFYYPEECRQLDLYRTNINKLENEYKQSLAFALMRRAMIRKMPYSRFTINWDKIVELRDEDASYEKYGRRRAYHNRSFKYHFENNLQDYNSAVFSNSEANAALNMDAFEAIDKADADVIYIDPPYAGTMNDYYAFYGVLDSYITGCEAKPFANSFTDKHTITSQFDKLFSKLGKYKYWMISYNSRSIPSKDTMLDLLAQFTKEVTVHEMPYAYRVTGKQNKHTDTEYLFIAKS